MSNPVRTRFAERIGLSEGQLDLLLMAANLAADAQVAEHNTGADSSAAVAAFERDATGLGLSVRWPGLYPQVSRNGLDWHDLPRTDRDYAGNSRHPLLPPTRCRLKTRFAMNEPIKIPPGFRTETEVLGLERITWLVHPDGRARALLRTEWLGEEPTTSEEKRKPSRKQLIAVAKAASDLLEAMTGDWLSESTDRIEQLRAALVDAGWDV